MITVKVVVTKRRIHYARATKKILYVSSPLYMYKTSVYTLVNGNI